MSGLTDAEYHWRDDADPRDAAFLTRSETRPVNPELPAYADGRLAADYAVWDADLAHVGTVTTPLDAMPDANEQPVQRRYRVEDVDDGGRITAVEWGKAVDEAWKTALERRGGEVTEGNDDGGLTAVLEEERLTDAVGGAGVEPADEHEGRSGHDV